MRRQGYVTGKTSSFPIRLLMSYVHFVSVLHGVMPCSFCFLQVAAVEGRIRDRQRREGTLENSLSFWPGWLHEDREDRGSGGGSLQQCGEHPGSLSECKWDLPCTQVTGRSRACPTACSHREVRASSILTCYYCNSLATGPYLC